MKTILAALACAGASVVLAAQPAQDPVLARSRIIITGGGISISPAHQVVPRNIATIVESVFAVPGESTHGSNGNGDHPDLASAFPPDAILVAELIGPSLGAPVTLTTRAGEPFKIQPLAVAGLHFLRGIRLVSAGSTLLTANPDTVTLEVIDRVLVSQVTSRPLSADEIRDRGIVVDQTNYQVINFSAAFGFQDRAVTLDFPMIVPARPGADLAPASPPLQLPSLQPSVTPTPSIDLPRLVEAFQTANVSVGGLLLKVEDEDIERAFAIPPLSGVIVIPGNIAYLNQFFSILTLVSNAAPGHSNLTAQDVTAEIVLPAGVDTVAGSGDDPLRMARLGTPPAEQARQLPVTLPGPDGKLGTPDDIQIIAPQQSGNSEHLVEGLREGTHTIEIKVRAMLHGLPIGPVPISGRVLGTVEVRNPTFALTLSHPATISAGEEYDLLVTLTNTSRSPANLASVNLLPRSISGATLLSAQSVQVETIAPGDAETVAFRLLSHTTGTVTATSFTSEGIPGRFELTTAVGALGIPMSPNTLVLPPAANALPEALRMAGLRFLGQAFALATAPVTPEGLLPLGQQIVYDRGTGLAQAGQRVSLREPLGAVVRDLFLEWTGNDFARLPELFAAGQEAARLRAEQNFRGFDALFRQSRRGQEFVDALAVVLAADLDASGLDAFHSAWAQATVSRAPHVSAIVTPASGSSIPLALELLDPALRRTGRRTPSVAAESAIPFAAYAALPSAAAGSQIVALSSPQNGVHELAVTAGAAGAFDLSVLVPEGPALRRLTFQAVQVIAGSRAALRFTIGGSSSFELAVDDNGDGVADRTFNPTSSAVVTDQGPRLVAAVQFLTGREDLSRSGQLVALVFSEEITRASSQAGLAPALLTNYAVERNQVLGAALQPGGRVVLLSLRDGIGPFVPRTVTVQGIQDRSGNSLSPTPAITTMVSTILEPGGVINGRVLKGDGTPVPRAQIQLAQSDGFNPYAIVTVKDADTDGRYGFDFVRARASRLEAVDPETGERGEVYAAIRHNGQHLDLDIILVGTGTIAGRALSPAGAPLPDAVVRVTSLTRFGEVRAARTDATGAFSVASVPVGNVTIEAAHVGTNSRVLRASAVPVAGAVVVEDLTLVPSVEAAVQTGSLAGQVFRSDGVTPAAGIPVFTSRGGIATTDVTGAFRIDLLPVGELTVRAIDQGRFEQASVVTTVVVGTSITANLRLVGGTGSVRGVVLSADGQPVAGAQVGGGSSLQVTSATGEFQLNDMPLGTRTISALDPATKSTGSASVTLNVPGETAAIQIVLDARGTITGRVFDSGGLPVAGLRVFLLGGVNLEATTDEAGGYRFENVTVGSYQVSAFLTDFSDGNIVNTRLTFRGEVRVANVTFRGKGRVTGVVLADNGVTPLGARVGLSEMKVRVGQLRPAENFHCLGNVQVGGQTIELPQCRSVGLGFRLEPLTRIVDNDVATGRFTFEDVLVGSVTVEAANALIPIVMAARGEIEAPGQTIDLQLRLAPTSAVTGVVLMPDGTPAGEDIVVTLDGRTVVTDAAGRFTHFEVAPGSFNLTALDPETGFVGRVTGNVAPGVTADMTIRLLGRGTLGIEVRGVNGLLAGAAVRVTAGGYPNEVREGVTGPNGRIVLAGGDALFEGPVSVRATDPQFGVSGFASGTITRDAQLELVVEIPNQSGVVEGRFLNAPGTQPIPNAQIRLSSSGGEAFATTLADGSFRFEGVRMGGVSLEAFDPVTARRGKATGTLSSHGQLLSLEIRQVPQGSVRGVVRISTDESAVAAATVVISVSSVFGAQYRTTTNTDGSFVFPGVSAGTFSLSASASGLSGSASGALEDEGEIVALDVVLQVPARGRVQGTVTTAAGGPALGAQVLMGSRQTTVDNAGFYFFDDVPMGGVSVRAIALAGPDGGVATGSLAYAGEVAAVNITFVGTGSIAGTVRSGGAPVAFATVSLATRNASGRSFSATTQTNGDGQYAFGTVPVGDVSVTARQAGTQLAGTSSATISGNGQSLGLDITLEPSAAFRARILREGTNQPASFMGIELVGAARRFGSTLADGTLRFTDLPLGTYQLIVTDPLGEGIVRATVTLAQDGAESDLGDLTLDEAPPRVLSISPANGAAHVSVNGSIVVQFSEPVAAASVTASTIAVAVQTGSVPGDWTLSADFTTATFTPAARFADFTTVAVRVTTGVQDRVGRLLNEAVTSTFVTADSIPPQTQSVSPVPGATGVPPAALIRVSYNEAISVSASGGPAIEVRLGGSLVPGNIEAILNNTALVFTPGTALQPNAMYQVTVRPATDVFGNLQAQGTTFSFATIDTLAPVIQQLTSDPSSGFEGSSLAVTAHLTASDVASVEFMVNGVVIATDSASPFQTTIPVTAALRPSFAVSARATDTSGNISSLATLSIDVQSDTAPVASILAPADGATVNTGTSLTLRIRGTDDRGISRIAYQATGQVTNSGLFVVNSPVSPSEATFALTIPANAAPGPLLIRAAVTDTAGASSATVSATLTVVDRTVPSVQILSPGAGSSVMAGQTATVVISVSDNANLSSITVDASGAVTFSETRPVASGSTTAQATFEIPVPADLSGTPSLTVGVRARDAAGNESVTVTRLISVIVPDTTPPGLTVLSPAEGATFRGGQTVTFTVRAVDNVAVERITFNASGAVTSTSVQNIEPSTSPVERTFTVALPPDVAPGSLVLTAEVLDTSGLSSGVAARNVVVQDGAAPAVRIVTPAAGASADPRNPITVTVEATDAIGVTSVTFNAAGVTTVTETRAIDPAATSRNEVFTVTFAAPPVAGGSLTLSATARDAAGNVGQATAVVTVLDIVAPTIVAVTPADGATAVDPASSVVVQFSESMDGATVTPANLAITREGVTVAATLVLTTDGRTATLTPQEPLALAATYSVVAAVGLADRAGNPLATARTFSFSTAAPDTTGPRVQSTSPTNGAVDVALSTSIEVTFTEAVAVGSVTPTSFRVTAAGSPVQGTFSFADSNTRVRFAPSAPLQPDTVVAVELTNGITDAAGNAQTTANGDPLTTPFTFTFATGRFGIVTPRADTSVVENTSITIEAQASASLGVASVVFTVNGEELTPVGPAPFRRAIQVPSRASADTLTLVASARNAQNVEVATDTRVLPIVRGLTIRPTLSGVPLGEARRISVLLSSVATEAVSVQLRAADPTVITFPVNPVVVPAGQTSVEAAVRGAAVGSTTVFAESSHGHTYAIVSVGAVAADTPVDVVAPAAGASLLLPPSIGMVIGDPGQSVALRVAVLAAAATVNTPVSVVSTNPLVATATASDVVAGEQTSSLVITTGIAGTATLVIRAGDQVRSITVVVGAAASAGTSLVAAAPVGASLVPAPGAIVFVPAAVGRTLSVRALTQPAVADTTVTVTSSDPAVVAVGSPATILTGEQVVTLSVTTGVAGRATITIDAGGIKTLLDVRVGAEPGASTPAAAARPIGTSVTVNPVLGRVFAPSDVTSAPTLVVRLLAAPATQPVPVVVTTSSPTIVGIGASPSINASVGAGQQTLEVALSIPGTEGASLIIFEYDGQRRQLLVIVGNPPASQIPAVSAPIVGVEIR